MQCPLEESTTTLLTVSKATGHEFFQDQLQDSPRRSQQTARDTNMHLTSDIITDDVNLRRKVGLEPTTPKT